MVLDNRLLDSRLKGRTDMIGGLISLIVWLLVVGILYLLVVWVIDSIPVPDPANRIIKLVLGVLLALVVVVMLLDLVGIGTGVNMPKLDMK
jgi:glucan phosphoethanolaminetransferase (alkaline phosphatase superfamily)